MNDTQVLNECGGPDCAVLHRFRPCYGTLDVPTIFLIVFVPTYVYFMYSKYSGTAVRSCAYGVVGAPRGGRHYYNGCDNRNCRSVVSLK